MFSAPYVYPSYQRPCRHYTPWSSCTHETTPTRRSSSVPRSLGLPRNTIAQQQQRYEQRAEQRRLIRAALHRVAPSYNSSYDSSFSTSTSSSGWHPRGAGAMLVADAKLAAQRLRDQEDEREEKWLRERLREETEWRREEERERWERAREDEQRWRVQMARRSEPPEDWGRGRHRSVQWAIDY